MTQVAIAPSDAVVSTLKWLRKQGYKPVALRPASKAAIDEKYVTSDYKPPDDSLWVANGYGVGVVTGPRQYGPVDVDIDCGEAAYFANIFLPPTSAVFGRKTKPRSHYLYKVEVEDCPKKAFIDPVAKSTVIEIRADGGHQTVMPGSIHEKTGELIEWSEVAFPEVAKVEIATLERAVKRIAIAVLIVRHMWLEGQRNEVVKHLAGLFYYLEWTEDETKGLIRAIMDYTDDRDPTRLKTVGSTYRKGERGGKITGANSLRSILGDSSVVDRILEWSGSVSAALLSDYNERFAVVTVEGKFRIAETGGLERGEPPTLYQKEDFLNLMATDTIRIDDKPVPKAKLWLGHPKRRQYRLLDFRPGEDEIPGVLNLWSGWALEPDAEAECVAWCELLYEVVCGANEELYSWMINWFANIVREPQVKPLTCPVMIGPQGAGKSLLFSYFGRILGPSYVTVTNEEHIYGRFNRHISNCLLLHSEEALYGGDRKHRGIIKSLITDEYRIFEQKGVDARRVRNFLRLALTSNDSWAAPAETDDRRFTIIDMQDRKITGALIKQVMKEFHGKGPAALFHHLLTMDYLPEVPRVNVKSEALADMKKINFDAVTAWWYETLQAGQILPDYLAWATDPAGVEWPEIVSSNALFLSFLYRCREHGQRVGTPAALAIQMNKLINKKLGRVQKYFINPMADDVPREVRLLPSKHYAIVNLPSLEECRVAFAKKLCQDIEWPEPASEKPAHLKF